RRLRERIRGAFAGRSSVAALVGRDQAEASRRIREDVLPVRPVAHAAVQPEQRDIARVAVRVVVQLDAGGLENHYGRTAVILRLGTWPTLICVISLRATLSTTETEFDPAFAT